MKRSNAMANDKWKMENGSGDLLEAKGDYAAAFDVTPTITNEGYVQVRMKLESSNVEASGTDATLTPSFTKRSESLCALAHPPHSLTILSAIKDRAHSSRSTSIGSTRVARRAGT